MSADVQKLIDRFGLEPHPEGGHYSETYRSRTRIQGSNGRAADACTAIYYLLHAGAWSAWHRIEADEIWHFYSGVPVNIHVLDNQQGLITHKLGDSLQTADTSYQVVIPGRSWFAAELSHPEGYALVGCTVAPGFEFSLFELANTEELARKHPDHKQLIQRLG
ncbi:cupin domain-containing protein [Pusillimonas sp. ANT_WB101]|uniref:cupin domain-containing protein n=1 Tax=Pusillimonas sp. ANT_WB101 TaxID=2597356 RepID=UPI0011EFEE06|nr:cupin domain-containing protein [Pusillimonas sp. ANT_WB101]KAA0893014.1 cupin domain-containing protein [Pusillimonas sp. ANT_WB101]